MGGSRDEVTAALAHQVRIEPDGRAAADRPTCVRRFVEWTMIDGDLVCRYVWHNLPDPTGGTTRYTQPGTELLRRLDGGGFACLGEFRNGVETDAMLARWRAAGGRAPSGGGSNLRGIVGWAPEPPPSSAPREEIERAFGDFASRLASAAASGEWAPVAAAFTDEVRVRDHVSGFVEGRHALSAWIQDGVKRSPFKRYDVRLRIVEGSRVAALLRAQGPTGGLDVNVLLHYGGEGRWAYIEVVYNPQEIRRRST